MALILLAVAGGARLDCGDRRHPSARRGRQLPPHHQRAQLASEVVGEGGANNFSFVFARNRGREVILSFSMKDTGLRCSKFSCISVAEEAVHDTGAYKLRACTAASHRPGANRGRKVGEYVCDVVEVP